MSPRAAWRLESLGFTRVYDYAAGKADWFAYGLPREGENASIPRVGDVARRDVPTCGLFEHIGDVRQRARAAGWDTCLVLNDEGVVLGRMRGSALAADEPRRVDEVMENGPRTYRPDARLADVADQMQRAGGADVVVTTPDGRLVGVWDRASAVRALGRQ